MSQWGQFTFKLVKRKTQKLNGKPCGSGVDMATPMNVQWPNWYMFPSFQKDVTQGWVLPTSCVGSSKSHDGVARKISSEGIRAPKVPSDSGLVLLTSVLCSV